jgi:hypothetical protein
MGGKYAPPPPLISLCAGNWGISADVIWGENYLKVEKEREAGERKRKSEER